MVGLSCSSVSQLSTQFITCGVALGCQALYLAMASEAPPVQISPDWWMAIAPNGLPTFHPTPSHRGPLGESMGNPEKA